MFERIVIRQRSSESLGQSIDVGLLAEALLFYSEVILVVDYVLLRSILTPPTTNAVLELVESGFLKLVYEPEKLAIVTANASTPHERHDAVYIHARSHQLQNALPALLQQWIGKPGKARRLALRLERQIDQLQQLRAGRRAMTGEKVTSIQFNRRIRWYR